jgi:hypothetical protein
MEVGSFEEVERDEGMNVKENSEKVLLLGQGCLKRWKEIKE